MLRFLSRLLLFFVDFISFFFPFSRRSLELNYNGECECVCEREREDCIVVNRLLAALNQAETLMSVSGPIYLQNEHKQLQKVQPPPTRRADNFKPWVEEREDECAFSFLF